MKKIIYLMALIALLTFFLTACKKSDKQPKTTIEKVQGKWSLQSEVLNQHVAGHDDITTTPGEANDIIDFRTDGKVYSVVTGIQDTSTYALSGDTKIILDGTQSYDIKELTSSSFIIYNKEIYGTDEYDEITISLKR